ncbi:IS200/IS605 family transposase [Priestia megaterium]|uniref:IS200/IS605 family transposase n=1 Tax=Priestia megaterium TaxID=1404 RepID=UPI0031012F11
MENFTEIGVISARTCVYKMKYRLIWTVQDGKNVLGPELELFIQSVFKQIADEKEFMIHNLKVLNQNYIDVTVSAHPKIAPSYIVKMLKGISGRKIYLQFPDIKQKLEKGLLWTNNFYIQTIGSYSEDDVEEYIRKQFRKNK